MSSVLVIPDSHLKTEVIEHGVWLADRFMCQKIVLLGDYFDDWDSTDEQYERMFNYLKNLVRKDTRVIPLFGNHELSYMGYPCAGHNKKWNDKLRDYLEPNNAFLWCEEIDSVLYSHAGVCTEWLRNNKICTENDIRYKLKTPRAGSTLLANKINANGTIPQAQAGRARGGKYDNPSPVWADMDELMVQAPLTLKQIVGHTPVKFIFNYGNIWFTDVFSNGNECDEYLIVKNGTPRVLHYNDEYQAKDAPLQERIALLQWEL